MKPESDCPALSVIVLTHNEQVNLPACLESLVGLNCEVFVVDSGSTDSTLAIATAAGARTVSHPFDDYATQRNWAQQNLPIRTSWVLHLDADERLTAPLRGEIHELFTGQNQPSLDGIDGFLLCKKTIFLDRWIKHGGHYPSYHLRLFRLGKGFCEEKLYDQHFVVDGKIGKLKNDYLDVVCADLDIWLDRHIRWAELEARQSLSTDRGGVLVRPKAFGNPIERKRWLRTEVYERAPLYLRALGYWFYRYFLRLGFLDGREGFVFHFLQGLWFRLLVDIKFAQLRKTEVRNQKSAIPSHQPDSEYLRVQP